jgi:hypothetical protein
MRPVLTDVVSSPALHAKRIRDLGTGAGSARTDPELRIRALKFMLMAQAGSMERRRDRA